MKLKIGFKITFKGTSKIILAFICIFVLQNVSILGIYTLPKVYGLTKVKDYIISYDESENLFRDWMDYRKEKRNLSETYRSFSKESRIIPVPFVLEYENYRTFIDEKQVLYDDETPMVKLSGYKQQSILFYTSQSAVLKQQKLICITGADLEIRKYVGKKGTDLSLYQLSDENIFNFYLVNGGLLETNDVKELHAIYNVRKIKYYDTADCFDNLEKIKVNTLIYGVWGLSNYDVYSYSTRKNDRKLSYAQRGILNINRKINRSKFLKKVYDYYKITIDKPFNPFKKELAVNDDGGILYTLENSGESVGFVFIKDTVVIGGKLVDLNLEKVCVTGPAEIYASGFYNRFVLEKFLNAKIPYIYERDDIVFMVKTQKGYHLMYGIIPESRYPPKYDNGSCN